MSTEVVQQSRDWFPRAASLWCDMERGLYEHPDGRKPKPGKDGTYRVVKAQILRDCGITDSYHDPSTRIWKNPHFLKALEMERRRRDTGVQTAIAEIEAVAGPISGIGNKIIELIQERLEGDQEELSTKELLQYGPQWVRLGLEVDGKLDSQKKAGIDAVLNKAGAKLTVGMISGVLDLVKQHQDLTDRKLASMGMLVDGELEE